MSPIARNPSAGRKPRHRRRRRKASDCPSLAHAKGPSRADDRFARRLAHREHVAAVRAHVFIREGYRCRRCGRRAEEMHECRARGNGGEVSIHNSIAVCSRCHQRMTRHHLQAASDYIDVVCTDAEQRDGVIFIERTDKA